MLPVLPTNLLQQPIMVADAGFGRVVLQFAVVALVVGLQLHMVLGHVQKPDQPVNLVSRLLAESADTFQ